MSLLRGDIHNIENRLRATGTGAYGDNTFGNGGGNGDGCFMGDGAGYSEFGRMFGDGASVDLVTPSLAVDAAMARLALVR